MSKEIDDKKHFSIIRVLFLIVILALLIFVSINIDSLFGAEVGQRIFLSSIIKSLVVISAGYLVIVVVDNIFSSKIISGKERGLTEVQRIFPSISKIIRIIVFVVVVIAVTQIFGLDISVLLTGFGVGGIAIAFAARDTIANVFGSLSIVSDKTFRIGDRVKFAEHTGSVVEIGIRSTRIKTDSGTEVVIPNVKLSSGVVENISRGSIGIKEITLNLAKSNSAENIKKAIEVCEKALEKNNNITRGEAIFNNMNSNGMELRIRYELDYIEAEVQTRQELLIAIKKDFDESKIEL